MPHLPDVCCPLITPLREASAGAPDAIVLATAVGRLGFRARLARVRRVMALERRGNGTRQVSILVVDDDDAVREMLAETLQDFGYAVVQAASGEEALPLIAEDPGIDMLITDIRMPGMSGLELADRVERQHSGMKVIVTSGYFQPQPIRQRFLRKPFRIQELASAVEAELD